MTDVLIVGGGPAGSALAILLGRAGISVELFERSRFPREKPCGEGLMPAGVTVLERMGLTDKIGGIPFFGVRYHGNGTVATGRFPSNGHSVTGMAQRRSRFDHALFQAAAATPNVTARTGMSVDALLREGDRVIGVLVAGEPRRAKLVVGADGAQSRMRSLLGWNLPQRRKRIGMRAHFRLAPGQPPAEFVDIFVGRGHELYVTLLPENELLVAALAAPEALEKPPAQAFALWCGQHRGLASRLEVAEQITDLLTTSPLSGKSRHGVAPGVALLGDAAGFCDPVTGGGMAQALVSAELLAGYVARFGVEDQHWLDAFDRARRAMLHNYVRITRAMLWLAEHPRLAAQAVAVGARVPPLVSQLVGAAARM